MNLKKVQKSVATVGLVSILVRVDLAGHDHHPDQEHRPDDPECELGLPALACSIISSTSVVKSRRTLTDIPLLQEGKRIQVWPIDIIIKHICVALIVDVGTRKELYRGADDAGDEEDEQDEGEQHHGAGKELALCDVDDLNDDKYEGERAYRDAVGHDPGGTLACASRIAALRCK